MFLIIEHLIVDYAISSSHHPAIRSRMVRNWQLYCRDFPWSFGDLENLDDSKYLNSAKQCFINIQTFCKTVG